MATGVGNRIREARKLLGLSQDDLAKRMGLKNKSSICKVERGDDNLTTDTIMKYASALNCTSAYLMGWEDIQGNNTLSGDIASAYMKNDFLQSITKEEINLIKSYRIAPPDLQAAVCTILNVKRDSLEIPHIPASEM